MITEIGLKGYRHEFNSCRGIVMTSFVQIIFPCRLVHHDTKVLQCHPASCLFHRRKQWNYNFFNSFSTHLGTVILLFRSNHIQIHWVRELASPAWTNLPFNVLKTLRGFIKRLYLILSNNWRHCWSTGSIHNAVLLLEIIPLIVLRVVCVFVRKLCTMNISSLVYFQMKSAALHVSSSKPVIRNGGTMIPLQSYFSQKQDLCTVFDAFPSNNTVTSKFKKF